VKGLVFTTFFDFIEERYGADLLDEGIEAAALPHGGAYTAVGSYPYQEMAALVCAMARLTEVEVAPLLEAFGTFCIAAWVRKFPEAFSNTSLFDLLSDIDHFHETQVRKVYPDAQLPSFTLVERSDDHIMLDYRSCTPLAHLAVGVIIGAGAHFGTPVSVIHYPLRDAVRFEVSRQTSQMAA